MLNNNTSALELLGIIASVFGFFTGTFSQLPVVTFVSIMVFLLLCIRLGATIKVSYPQKKVVCLNFILKIKWG